MKKLTEKEVLDLIEAIEIKIKSQTNIEIDETYSILIRLITILALDELHMI